MKNIKSKMKALECLQAYMSFFFRRSREANSEVSSGIPPNLELIQAFMIVLIAYKNEEDPFSQYKSMGIFSDAQGQLTPQSLIKPGRNSNSSMILWLSLLPASMKKILSKTKALAIEC